LESDYLVSIPFIAGQWSLHAMNEAYKVFGVKFQSPSLRGSGRFLALRRAARGHDAAFQSPSLRGSGRFKEEEMDLFVIAAFQSPSLRGSGRFGFPPFRRCARGGVSIPFIAGQWSLRGTGASGSSGAVTFQSPSLRGSGRFHFVAHCRPSPLSGFQSPSLRGSGRFAAAESLEAPGAASFNPLHCGAVVASPAAPIAAGIDALVSIPFIAGQWSLQGQGGGHGSNQVGVSIPFIAGQWSLRRSGGRAMTARVSFQSPSLRGSGRFGRRLRACGARRMFQSPSLRGSGRFC